MDEEVQFAGIPEIRVNIQLQDNVYLTVTLSNLHALRTVVFNVEIGQTKQMDTGISGLVNVHDDRSNVHHF